jgi:hypothetical protein
MNRKPLNIRLPAIKWYLFFYFDYDNDNEYNPTGPLAGWKKGVMLPAVKKENVRSAPDLLLCIYGANIRNALPTSQQ